MRIEYVSPIDSHVHLRWEESDYTFNGMNFSQLGFRDAAAVGLRGFVEMPNTTPNILDSESAGKRIQYLESLGLPTNEIHHGIYGGVTRNLDQVRTAAILARNSIGNNGRVRGLKIYHAHSTGEMGITNPDLQKEVWKQICSIGPYITVTNHFEDECKYTGEFDYKNPMSHSIKQNPESEFSQAENQIRNARDAGYKGIMISAHTSNPNTIDYIISERKNVPFEIAIEMTLHHMLLNTDDYAIHGNGVKMNPPLRSKEMQERNLEHVLRGNVSMIGTDHAPHHPAKKLDASNKSPPSGIPAILAWPLGIAILRKNGISEELLEKVTFTNANKILFNRRLDYKFVDVEYNPDLWSAYGYNPFSRIEEELRI